MRLLTIRNHGAEAALQSIPGIGLPSRRKAFSGVPSAQLRSWARSMGLFFNKQLSTLDVKDGELRFVAFQKGRVVRWGMVTLDGGGENQEVGVSQLKALVKELGLGGRWVVSLPLRAALVRRLALPRIKGRYLGQVIAAEVAEGIPFSVEQVDLAWAAKKAQKGHRVVAIAVSKGTMDRTAAPLKAAGLRLAAMYPRATALAYVADVPDAVIVDLGATSAGVVLVENGIPRLAHEVELAGALISQAVEQVATQSQNPEDSENSFRPVLVTGNSGVKGITREEVERRLDSKVLALNPSLKLPGHFPVAAYATNLGLFFAYQARPRPLRRTSPGTMASVNVLPERYQARSLPVFPMGVFLSIALFAYAAVGFQDNLGVALARSEALASRLVVLERQDRAQRLERLTTEADKKRATATGELADKVEARLGRMSQDIKSVMADLDLIYSEAASLSVQITGVSLSADGYSVSGTALSKDYIITYAGRLRRAQAFQDVAINSIQSGAKARPGPEGEGVDPGAGRATFQLKALIYQPVPPSK